MAKDFHSSPSDINLFLEEPALWFIKHNLGYRTEAGPSAHRGTAVEYGLAIHLLHPHIDENFPLVDPAKLVQDIPIGTIYRTEIGSFLRADGSMADDLPWEPNESVKQQAIRRYRQLTMGEINDEIESEAENVVKMLDQSIEAMQGFGSLIQWQRRIDSTIEGIPVMGFTDFTYPEVMVDLKSTKAIPSEPRAGHVRQMAIYTHATGLPARLLYASGKKFRWHNISAEQSAAALRQVKAACRAMRRIRANTSWREAAEGYPPRDLGSFYYDTVSRYVAAELWGL